MDLTEMRSIVRRDLHDEDPAHYRWTDDELDRHIAHAVSDLSDSLPLEETAIKPTTPGSRLIDIADITSRVCVEALEYPVGDSEDRFRRFALWGNTLSLLGDVVPDGSDVCIRYGKLHTLDSSGSTLPARCESLVAGAASGYALVEWAAYAINRVNTGGAGTAGQLLQAGMDLLRHFRAELKILSRKNRVRARSLFSAPAGL